MSDEKSKNDEKKSSSWETKDKDLRESRELSLKERKKQEK
jgi:hypothetical protein